MKRILYTTSGLSIVEAIISIVIISVVAISISHVLAMTTRNVVQAHSTREAASLAQMVFEQYQAYAQQNYDSLVGVTNVTPKAFFHTNSVGYDGMTITTLAQYSTNGSSCTIKLTIGWIDGGSKSLVLYKSFTEGSPVPLGTNVDVYVKLPCDGQTSASYLMAHCPGLPGLLVSAPSSAMVSQGFTDATGHVQLPDVPIGVNTPIDVAAITASSLTISPTDPAFVQGYYVSSGPGNYLTTYTTSTPVVDGGAVQNLVISSIIPAGRIVGTLTNNAGGPVSGMHVDLTSGWAVQSSVLGTYNACSGTLCEVTTTAGGNYGIYNVALDAFSISANGIAGSTPTVSVGDGNYVSGYCNLSPQSFPASQWNSVMPSSAPTLSGSALSALNFGLDKLASLTVTAINTDCTTDCPTIPIGHALPSTLIALVAPAVPGRDAIYAQSTANAGGAVTFNNVFGSNSSSFTLYGYRDPVPGDHGFGAMQTWTCTSGSCLNGATNSANLLMYESYETTGTLVDSYGASPSGVTVYLSDFNLVGPDGKSHIHRSGVGTDVNGRFDFNSTSPFSFNPIFVNPLPYANPGAPFAFGFTVTSVPHAVMFFTRLSPATLSISFSGTIIDTTTATPAAHANIQTSEIFSAGTYTTTAGTDGSYAFGPLTQGFAAGAGEVLLGYPYFNCIPSAHTCSASSSPTVSSAPFVRDSNSAEMWTQDITSYIENVQNIQGWWVKDIYAIFHNGVAVTQDMNATLISYMVQGTVVDSIGSTPLGGITVQDAAPGATASTITASDGTFTLWCLVQGRHNPPDNAAYPGGWVSLQVPNNQAIYVNGGLYQPAVWTPTTVPALVVPVTADPQQPLQPTLSLLRLGGGGL